MRARSLAAVLAATLAAQASAQTMSISTSNVVLPAPDSLVYDAGLSPHGTLTIMVTACAGPLGCRLTIENPNSTSPVPVDLQWRLVQVSEVGSASLGCSGQIAPGAWQPVPLAPSGVMDTGVIDQAGASCVAAIEVRAINVSWSVHQFTSPPTTFWRELTFRTAEK